jgi:thiosulfate/3-mercaptopyruvate sulfurtransferase
MKLKATIAAGLLAITIGSFCSLLGPEVVASTSMPPVVSTAWLADHLDDPDLITLHIGPAGSYDEGHIPGARAASLRKIVTVNEAGIRDEMLEAEDIAEALSELGIKENSRIAIYFSDENAAWAVARYLLTLEYVGMTGRVAYVDGGLPQWVAEKRPVSKETPSFETTDLAVTISPGVVESTEWLITRIENPKVAIIDGRPSEGYTGLSGHWDRLGHIAGAKNIPFFTLLSEDPPYLLKSRDDLRDIFLEAGADKGDTVVVYCGTGLWASLPYLAARYLGYEARLYDGSFQEWAATADLPVTEPAQRSDSDH